MYLSSSGRAVFATRPVEGLVLVGWSETRRLLKFSLGTREVLADFEQVPVDNRAERLVQKTKIRRSEKGAFPTSQLVIRTSTYDSDSRAQTVAMAGHSRSTEPNANNYLATYSLLPISQF